MWRSEQGALYLEPGEVAALADAIRQVLPLGPPQHPRDLMLAALAQALPRLGGTDGLLLAQAGVAIVQEAAAACFLAPTPPTPPTATLTAFLRPTVSFG